MNRQFVYDKEKVRRLLEPYLSGSFKFEQECSADDGSDLLLRWGNISGEDSARHPVNPKWAVELARNRRRMMRNLRLHLLPTPGFDGRGRINRAALQRRYRVYIFDMETVAIFRRSNGRNRRVKSVKRKRRLRMESLASRALYATGLHFGAVDIGVTGGSLVVLNVLAAPPLTRYLARAIAPYILSYAKRCAMWENEPQNPKLLLGADPEFVLRSTSSGGMVSASRFFSRFGTIGCDARARISRGNRWYPIGEIRPRPTGSPHQLVDRIGSALMQARRRVRRRKKIALVAGSLPFGDYPIGGHIHFSNVERTTPFLRALDNYLAIPMMLLEHPRRSRRRRVKFGALGEIRRKAHGGLEYRTLGSWIHSPEATTAVLCLAKIIATEYPRLQKNFLDSPEALRDFHRSRKERFREIFPELWATLSGTPTFRQYEEDVDVVRRLVEERKRWKEDANLVRRWKRR